MSIEAHFDFLHFRLERFYIIPKIKEYTVCPGSSDPPEKLLNIFASENEDYTIF